MSGGNISILEIQRRCYTLLNIHKVLNKEELQLFPNIQFFCRDWIKIFQSIGSSTTNLVNIIPGWRIDIFLWMIVKKLDMWPDFKNINTHFALWFCWKVGFINSWLTNREYVWTSRYFFSPRMWHHAGRPTMGYCTETIFKKLISFIWYSIYRDSYCTLSHQESSDLQLVTRFRL